MFLDLILMGSTTIMTSRSNNTNRSFLKIGKSEQTEELELLHNKLVDLYTFSRRYYKVKHECKKNKNKFHKHKNAEELTVDFENAKKYLYQDVQDQNDRFYLSIIENFLFKRTKSNTYGYFMDSRYEFVLALLKLYLTLRSLTKEQRKELKNIQKYDSIWNLNTAIMRLPYERVYKKIQQNLIGEWRRDFNSNTINSAFTDTTENFTKLTRPYGYFDASLAENVLLDRYNKHILPILKHQRRYDSLKTVTNLIKSSLTMKYDLKKLASFAWIWPGVKIIKRTDNFLFLRVNSYYYNTVFGPKSWCVTSDRMNWLHYTYSKHYLIFDMDQSDYCNTVVGMSMHGDGGFRAHNYHNHSMGKDFCRRLLKKYKCKMPSAHFGHTLNVIPKLFFWAWI